MSDGRDRRTSVPMRPECAVLENRQLLSTADLALPATSLIPPAAEVANAAAVLTSKAGEAFTKYTEALGDLERTSRVTPAEFAALAQDKAAIDAAIDAADLSPSKTQDTLNLASDYIDAAFTELNASKLQDEVIGDLTGVTVSPQVLSQTFAEMRVIGRAAVGRASKAEQSTFAQDKGVVSGFLGPSPNTDIWPGAKRDPLVVYYNGQVGNFVRVR